MKCTLGAVWLALSAIAMLPAGVSAQVPYAGGARAAAMITQQVDERAVVVLPRNTRAEANADNDNGRAPDNFPLPHLLLQLRRPPELEQELTTLIDEMHQPGSPVFHQWLTAAEFGRRFGPSQQDVQAISAWLASHGFRIDSVLPSGMLIEFSGTAGQVRDAFRTEIHSLNVNGERHFANMSDPQIPAALAAAVDGIVSLHDFRPHTHLKMHPDFQVVSGTSTYEAVAPPDLATIYNLGPLFAAGINGTGQTIVVIEDTLIQNVSDVSTFRSAFGLTGGSFAQGLATGTIACSSPGVNGDEGEAALDAEWAGASAPGAHIVLAACANTATVFGGLIAFQNLINSATPPPIVSISYGECESANGAAANQSYVNAYQQAAAEGTSVFVAAGDEGAASCDPNATVATHGIAVSGFASTPYNVAVGGTDFGDTYLSINGSPKVPVSTYWNATNSPIFESAKSYVPEIPWNNSCASRLIYTLEGFTQSFGASGFCNSTTGRANFRTTGAGSGGPSTFSPQPSWQTSVVGLPTQSGGKRYLPDVSLFAANGVWSHFFVFCNSDAAQGGSPCVYTNATDVLGNAAGGTSFSAPIMAGIMALVNQSNGGAPQGNPNPRLYAIAAAEYGASGSTACNSSLGTGVSGACFFYDVTLGDIDVNCSGSINCFGKGSGSVQGELSTSSTSDSPAYATNTGWDFATGIGTLNVANFVRGWTPAFTTTTVTSGLNPSMTGAAVTLTARISSANSLAVTGTVTWSANTGCGTTAITAGIPGVATCTTSLLAAGSDIVTATYSGDITHLVGNGSVTQQVNVPALGGASLGSHSVRFATKQLVGTTSAASQVVQVTSSGSAALLFSAFNGAPATASFTMGGGDFHVQTNCPLAAPGLAVGSSCTFTFVFSPTAAGVRTANLLLTDNAPDSPQTIAASGSAFVVDDPTVTLTVGAGSSRLQALQNPDGGWPFDVNFPDCGFGADVSCPNTIGITGLGLLAGYTRTGTVSYLTSATAAGNLLVNLYNAAILKTPQGLSHSQDVEFLMELGQLTGNATYTNTALAWFAIMESQYPNAADRVDLLFTMRDTQGLRSLAAWDAASFIRAAKAIGDVNYATAAASRVVARSADWQDTNPAHRWDQCPSQACGPADNPFAFDYTILAEGSLLWSFNDLPGFDAPISAYRTFLIAQQDPQGSWDVGDSQMTAYVLFGLAAVGGTGTDTAMSTAAAFYIVNQLPAGGWPGNVTPSGNADEFAEADAEVERAMQTLFSTQAGSNVVVAPAQLATLTFGTVTSAGLTSVVATAPSPATMTTRGFQIVDGLTYNVITTATIKNAITTCFTVPWITDAATFARARVMHLEKGVLVDRTLRESGPFEPDFGRKRVCGLTGSLNAFAIALQTADTTPPSMTVRLTPSVLEPTGRLETIRAIIDVSDDADPAPAVQLISVTSNEPHDGRDIVHARIGTDDRLFQLRAESVEHDRPLVYTVVYRATDTSGNACEVSATVTVRPEDRREFERDRRR
jgi:hypothetical protein